MTITLTPEHERLVSEAILSGAYQNPDDVIGRALEMLQSEREWLQDQKDSIGAKIEHAFAQFDRGEFMSAEESRADMAKRKARWFADQQSR